MESRDRLSEAIVRLVGALILESMSSKADKKHYEESSNAANLELDLALAEFEKSCQKYS